MAKERNSSIELLRILAMVGIVFHHFSVHGGFSFPADVLTVNRLWVQLIAIGGKLGVNVFVLISGYFMIEMGQLRLKKLLVLAGQIWFWSVGLYAVFLMLGKTEFSVLEAVKACLPITFGKWWFASAYMVLYILSPFLNRLLRGLSREQYHKLLLTGFVLWCLLPTFTGQLFGSNDLLWFMFVYACSAYVKLHGIPRCPARVWLWSGVGMLGLTYLSVMVFDLLGLKYTVFAEHATFFYEAQRLPTFFSSLLLFLGFRALQLGTVPVINKTASAAFGVYLIHDHFLVRKFLWMELFANRTYSDNAMLPIYSVGVVLLVFAACTVLELIRQRTAGKLWEGLIDKTGLSSK